jgi:hypothetical protein
MHRETLRYIIAFAIALRFAAAAYMAGYIQVTSPDAAHKVLGSLDVHGRWVTPENNETLYKAEVASGGTFWLSDVLGKHYLEVSSWDERLSDESPRPSGNWAGVLMGGNVSTVSLR